MEEFMYWAVGVLLVGAFIASIVVRQRKLKAMTPDERATFLAGEARQRDANKAAIASRQHTASYGPVNPLMTCPHCGVKGVIRTKAVTNKKGVSGGKATAAILTGGVSLLATGLSRKEQGTQAFCDNCKNAWSF